MNRLNQVGWDSGAVTAVAVTLSAPNEIHPDGESAK
jgi:hypothetical protein